MSGASSESRGRDPANAGASGSHALFVKDGVLAGGIGAGIVALWFLVLDFGRGQPFYTPSLLGNVLLLGRSVEEATSINWTMVVAYTGLHGVLFLITGTVVSWMFHQFEHNPQFGFMLLLLFFVFESVLFGFEVTLVPNLVGTLGAFAVGVANLLSATGMFWFLLHRHPDAFRRLREAWYE